jgi:protein required for attachment to host cells
MAAAIPAADKHYLVVVADESAAILYTAKKRRGPLEEWRRFENEAARMKTGDLISDRGGRSFDSHGQGRHTMASEKAGPRQHIATRFAKTVAETIAQEMRGGRCAGYSLVVAPRFLGELRKEIGKLVRTSPLATVDKDVIGMDVAVVEKLLESG